MSRRFVCVHGHFYQPPRENPWLEEIELQDSAAPYHDWNERITEECYAANASSRVLDGQGRIAQIINNYSRISFNFGATLLTWLEQHAPETYAAILRADKLSQQRFRGHGAAIAQVYNHLIMPLANERDRRTQIWWGLRDFEHRFDRKPEGMWLGETAADLETLDLLAEYGIRFTILAPNQAARVRPLDGSKPWQDVGHDRVDPTRAYLQKLPSGRTINLFFYDGPISRAIAFEGLLERGEVLANRLAGAFSPRREHAQLVHIATDGETYGHHHRHGEMALSYALRHIEEQNLAQLTVYGEFLDLYPPSWEVELRENTSWSCVHGVERWRSDCGCHTGGGPGWNQKWRAPLRDALDFLRDAVAGPYEAVTSELLHHPWNARDDFIEVVLDRSRGKIDSFLLKHRKRSLSQDEEVRVLELLELQRHAMLMYTSCGWFFNDLSGIETTQILQYAARVLQLAKQALGLDLEGEFLQKLSMARSNIKSRGNGQDIYEADVRPAQLSLEDVCAHYAISSLFEHSSQRVETRSYDVENINRTVHDSGRARMAIGRARIISRLTHRSECFDYGVLHLGDHNVDGGIRPARDLDPDQARQMQLAVETFSRAEFPTLIRLLDKQFGHDEVFSLRSLFRDEQRRVLERIMTSAIEDARSSYRAIYERRAPLMAFLANLDSPIPRHLVAAAKLALEDELGRLLEAQDPPVPDALALLEEANNVNIELEWDVLEHRTKARLEQMVQRLGEHPSELEHLERLANMMLLLEHLPFPVRLWTAQNVVFDIIGSTWPEQISRARAGDAVAGRWVKVLSDLATRLSISPQAWPKHGEAHGA